MSLVDQIDLRAAESAFAVANTPLFLMRKLRSDPAVALLARNRRGEELLKSLRDIARTEPNDLLEFVLPYIYLIALSLKQDLPHLREAAQITQPYADWYKYIGDYLVQSTHPTARIAISFPQQAVTPNRAGRENLDTGISGVSA
jgi:hypothetical protein